MNNFSFITFLESVWHDLRFSARSLRKNWAFTLTVIVSLAVGIGANAAMVSVVDALVLRPLPVPRPKEVITIDTASNLEQYGNNSYLDYIDIHKRSNSFQE